MKARALASSRGGGVWKEDPLKYHLVRNNEAEKDTAEVDTPEALIAEPIAEATVDKSGGENDVEI